MHRVKGERLCLHRVNKGWDNSFDNSHIILLSMFIFFRKWKWMKTIVVVLNLNIWWLPYLFLINMCLLRKWRRPVHKGCNNSFDNRHIILPSMFVCFKKWKWMKTVCAAITVSIIAIHDISYSYQCLFSSESESEWK